MRFERLSSALPALLLAVLACGPTTDARAADVEVPALPALLDHVVASVAVGHRDVMLVPLLDRRGAAPSPALAAHTAKRLRVLAGTARGEVLLRNDGKLPIFVPSGALLHGAQDEHILLESLILMPAETRSAQSVAYRHDATADDPAASQPLDVLPAMAPRYLREAFLQGKGRETARLFLQRFVGFLADSDERGAAPTLARLTRVLAEGDDLSAPLPPSLRDPRVIGFASVIHGRVHALEIFASHDLLRAYGPLLLDAQAYRLRALASRGDALGIVAKQSSDPVVRARRATTAVRTLLEDLRERARYRLLASAADDVSRSWDAAWPGVRGRALDAHGRLVHAVLFPHDPYERALYGGRIEPDRPEDTPPQPGVEELQRRSERGTTTETEERRLRRLRSNGR